MASLSLITKEPNVSIANGSSEVTTTNEHPSKETHKTILVWRNIFGMTILHMLGFYGAYLTVIGYGNSKTVIWYYFVTVTSAIGVTVGAHRLWCHRCYKAKWPLRVVLAIWQTVAGQNDIYEWTRDHRVHHKFSETDADPHNSHRGFFFAHMGWLLCRKHPNVYIKGKSIDLSDLWSDPIIRFQRRFYIPMLAIFWGAIPILVPVYFWNESIIFSGLFNFSRYLVTLHQTWLVNSAAHLWGIRPYDTKLRPVEQAIVSYFTVGEGYHNYHHAFPYDYSASEYGWSDNFNPSTAFIDLMAKIGLAYDLKKPDKEMINRRKERSGDGFDNYLKGSEYVKHMIIGNLLNTWPLWTFYIIQYSRNVNN